MLIITKNANQCYVTGNEKLLEIVRKIVVPKLTILNTDYQFIERNKYASMNKIRSLKEEKENIIQSINNLKSEKIKKRISQYDYTNRLADFRSKIKELNNLIEKKEFSLRKIELYLKYNQPEYSFYRVNRDTGQDTYKIGFHRKIIKLLKKNNISFQVGNYYSYPKVKLDKKNFNRKYQYHAVRKILKKKFGIIKLPTGSGKTEIARCFFDALLPSMKENKQRLLFVVEQSDLLMKTKCEDFTDINTNEYRFSSKVSIGLLGAGFKDTKQNIIIATVQTLSSLKKSEPKEFKKWASTFGAYVVDECDMFVTDKRIKILEMFKNARYRLFLSATPFSRFKEMQKMKLIGVSGGIIFTIDERELVKNNFLAKQEAVFLKSYNIENDRKFPSRNKWQQTYSNLIVRGKSRNKLLFETYKILSRNGLRALFVVENLEHGNELKNQCNIPFYSGANDVFERRRAVEELQSGVNPIIITTRIFRRAINIPELQVYVNAAGMKSDNIVTQGKGRIGRLKKQNESKSLYLDIFDYGNDILEKHSEERMITLKELGIKVNGFYVNKLEEYIQNYFGIVSSTKEEDGFIKNKDLLYKIKNK